MSAVRVSHGAGHRDIVDERGNMRLRERERDIIKGAVTKHFGEDARVWLFGSRADDTRRGGDIDLLVETERTGREALRAKIAAITEIQVAMGDQKIDVITCAPRSGSDTYESSLIVTNARREGIPL